MVEETGSNQSVNAKEDDIFEYVWTQREKLLHLQTYTPLSLLIDFVEKTRTKFFYDYSGRCKVIMLINSIRMKAPFSANKRFPEEYWVNLSVGFIAQAFDRLQTAIDIPNPERNTRTSDTDLTSYKKMFDAAILEIRRVAFYTDPQQLADVGVYDRATFEDRFHLKWTD